MPIRRSPNGAHHVRPQPGRNRPEWVVAINRNAWSQSVGTGGRNHPVRATTRGTHVLKALSVGAKACSGGRLYLYALARRREPFANQAAFRP